MSASGVARLCHELDITYRQFDFWCTQGYLGGPSLTNHGHGCPRQLTTTQRRVLARMAELVHQGTPAASASRLARRETPSPEELTAMWDDRGELV